MVRDHNGPYINKFQTIQEKSVFLPLLSSVSSLLPKPAYLEYLLTVCIIFFTRRTIDFLHGMEINIPLYVWKTWENILQKRASFAFDSTYCHSQNVCLLNSHILIYWYARCDCKLCDAHWFYCVFWVFSYIIDDHSCLKCWISTKLSQIVCLINNYILVCQNAKCDCWLSKVFLN